jgi:hypothetical protein
VLHGIVAAGLASWARWVAQRHPGPWWQKQFRVPALGFLLVFIGTIVGAVLMWRAWSGIESEESGNKATRLAESVSLSLNWSGLFIIAGWLLFATSLVFCIVGSIKRPSALPTATVRR